MQISLVVLAAILLAACRSDIYVRDGVTDGDTFFLAPRAVVDGDPVLQSWVRYSLVLTTCQLEIGGENPARNSSYECELRARERLVEAWRELRDRDDRYLETLATVAERGLLDEYVAWYFARDGWRLPDGLDNDAFERWRRQALSGHRPQTRLIGSWGFRETDPGGSQ